MTLSDSTQPDQLDWDHEPVDLDDLDEMDAAGYIAELIAAQTRARKASTLSSLVLGLLVLAAVALCAIIAIRAQTNAERSSVRVGNLVDEAVKLRDTVDDLQTRLDESTAADDAVEVCTNRLAAAVRDTTRDYNAAEGDLIVALRPAAQGIPDQADTVDLAISELAVKLDAYRTATEKSSTWNVLTAEEKATVPCPV